MTDFFDSNFGSPGRSYPASLRAIAKDTICDLRLAASMPLRRILRRHSAPRRLLVVGVEVPSRAGELARITKALGQSRHSVDVSTITMKPQSKFANVDEAIQAAPLPLEAYNWLVITDDDVAFRPGFLDSYISLAEAADLAISQPAHRYGSYASYAITRRRMGSLVRSTRFVEIGPLTVLRKDVFSALVPFPASRWCYGIDLLWSQIADERGWRMGIVDAVPVGHMKPVAQSYDPSEAFAEATAFLAKAGVRLARTEVLQTKPLLRA